MKPKLLVIDDENINKHFYIKFFSNNYDVIIASSGEAGLTIAFNEAPDIIITDLMLPKINGIEVINKLKNNPDTCQIPVLLVTAYAYSSCEIIEKIEYLNKDDIFIYPIDIQKLRKKLQILINSHYAPRQSDSR